MSKNQNLFALAIKGVLCIYLPVVLLLYIIYKVILNRAAIFDWERILIYVGIIAVWTIRNYIRRAIEQDIKDFSSLKSSIIKGGWDIIEQNENSLIVKPKFDFPFRLLINDKVQIDYARQKAIIEGPWYYVNNLAKDITGRSSIWTKRTTNIVAFILIIALVAVSISYELGVLWDIKKSFYNSLAKNNRIIEIKPEEIVGNILDNTNNHGFGVENDKYVFYVENDLNLVRTNKDFQDKKYLIQKSSGTGVSRLNLAGDWIYYTSGKNLNRMRIDGTDNEVIYKLGYLLDINMKDSWLYFINHSDNYNIYRMDINGRNLERFLRVQALDIALYDDIMIFSHKDNGKAYVESINLDGSNRKVELEVLAYDLVEWDGYYYYIGEDHKLFRSPVEGKTTPQVLVDDKVSSYIITEAGIFYSLHSEDAGYPGQGIYKTSLEGSMNTLIADTELVEGLTRIGDWILFRSSDNHLEPPISKRLNVYTNVIEIF